MGDQVNAVAVMESDTYPRLVGDVGGTNARFAWKALPGLALADIATYPCADHPSLQHAMQHYLAEHAKPPARWCYRLHLTLEKLSAEKKFNAKLTQLLRANGR